MEGSCCERRNRPCSDVSVLKRHPRVPATFQHSEFSIHLRKRTDLLTMEINKNKPRPPCSRLTKPLRPGGLHSRRTLSFFIFLSHSRAIFTRLRSRRIKINQQRVRNLAGDPGGGGKCDADLGRGGASISGATRPRCDTESQQDPRLQSSPLRRWTHGRVNPECTSFHRPPLTS